VGGVDLWQQWWVGDQVRQVPPLWFLDIEDLNHLDVLPLGAEERIHSRLGKAKEKRRPATTILSDLRFVMRWITTRVEEAGRMEEEITILAVDRMFEVVAGHFSEGEHNGQKKWPTVIRSLWKKQ